MERIHNSLYVLHHLIGGIGQSSWELSYPVYRFDCGDLTGDSCPEIAVGVIKTTRHDPTRDKRLFLFKLYQGRQGLADTYQALRASGITPLGYGHSTEEQLSPAIIRKKGVKAAVFNAVLFPLENWQHAEGQPDVSRPSIDRLAGRIRQYKAEHPSSFIVAVLHWGTEFQPHPHVQQRYYAHKLMQAGTDAIVRHHPHVVQPLEHIGTHPVFYSLGNFVFDQSHPDCRKASMALLRFKASEVQAWVIPVKIRQCRPHIIETVKKFDVKANP